MPSTPAPEAQALLINGYFHPVAPIICKAAAIIRNFTDSAAAFKRWSTIRRLISVT